MKLFTKKLVKKLTTYVLITSIIGTLAPVKITYGDEIVSSDGKYTGGKPSASAGEVDFYLNFNVDDLPFEQIYDPYIYALSKDKYTEDELINMVTKFFAATFAPTEEDIDRVKFIQGGINYDYKTEYGNGILYSYSVNYDGYDRNIYSYPYLYGEEDPWKAYGSLIKDNYVKAATPNITVQTNIDAFNNVNIPYARTEPVVLRLYEIGVPIIDKKTGEKVAMPRSGSTGSYFYIFIPDGSEGEAGSESGVKEVYYKNTLPFPDPKQYLNGKLTYYCGDPIEVVSGSFIWSYADLRILGKHQMEFARYYSSQSEEVGSLGKGFINSYDYTLKVKDEKAYFTLPTGEGIPFSYDEETDTFKPSSVMQTNYTLSFTNADGVTRSGSNELYVNENINGTMVRGYVGAKVEKSTSGGGLSVDGVDGKEESTSSSSISLQGKGMFDLATTGGGLLEEVDKTSESAASIFRKKLKKTKEEVHEVNVSVK